MKKILRNKDFFIVLFLLIVAAFLRFYRIADYMTFLGDEGRDVLVVYNILHGQLTLLGPTSSVGGFFLGPIYYYFMAPFLWLFNYNPVGPAVMVAVFGIATVLLVYFVGKEFFGRTAGFIAALMYGVSPVVLVYSRSSWNPNLMPFFTLVTLYFLYKSLYKKNIWLLLLSGFLFGISMQLHYVETFVGVIIALYILVVTFATQKSQKASWIRSLLTICKGYGIFLIGFLMGLAPWLAFEARHGFPNTQSLVKFIFFSGDTGGGSDFIQQYKEISFRLFARLLTAYPPQDQIIAKMHPNIGIWTWLTVLLALVCLGIFIFQAWHVLKRRDKAFFQYSLIVIWFIVGIFLFGFYKKSIYDYYFAFMFPLPFFFFGNAFAFFAKQNILLKFVAITTVIILIIVNVRALPFWFPANRQLLQAETIASFVNNKTNGKPFNFALITGGNSDHAYRYFFKLWGHDPVVIQNDVIDPKRKSVTKQLLVVCESVPCEPLGASLWEVAGFGRADIVGQWDVSVVKVYKLVKYQGSD